MKRKHPTAPTRRFQVRYTCLGEAAGRCRLCARFDGYHQDSSTGDLERARRSVLYLQRADQQRQVSIFDTWTGQVLPFRGYEIHIWRSIDGHHRLEAWGDPSYRAPTACSPGGGTFSLVVRESRGGASCRLLVSSLPLLFLAPLREATGALLPEEDCVAFARWAVRQLRDADPDQVDLLRDKICSVCDWPGSIPVEQLLSPAA